jgi:hypothetical protein
MQYNKRQNAAQHTAECSTTNSRMQYNKQQNAAQQTAECSTTHSRMQHNKQQNAAQHTAECSTTHSRMQHNTRQNAAQHTAECSTTQTQFGSSQYIKRLTESLTAQSMTAVNPFNGRKSWNGLMMINATAREQGWPILQPRGLIQQKRP